MSRLPVVLFHSDLPEAELHAAKLDGELYPVDQCFSPIDEIDTRGNRAKALLRTVPARLIAEQRTAAWIYGALSRPPRQHQFCADISARVRPSGLVGITVREVVVDASDLVDIAGLLVTTPLRTVVDLARASVNFELAELRTVGELMRIGQFGFEECRVVLERRRNLPHKRLALDRITEAARRSAAFASAPFASAPSRSNGGADSAAVDPVHVVDGVDAANCIEHRVQVRRITHFENKTAEGQAVTRGRHGS